MQRFRLLAAVLLATSVVAACDDDDDPVDPGEPTVFSVVLNRGSELTACAGNPNAAGTATVTINASETQVQVTNLNWANLSAAATMAHIHFGDTDEAGPIVLDFGATPTSPITRTFTAANYIAAAGAPATFAAFLDEMRDGDAYINIHTTACAAGEIRGQLVTTTP